MIEIFNKLDLIPAYEELK